MPPWSRLKKRYSSYSLRLGFAATPRLTLFITLLRSLLMKNHINSLEVKELEYKLINNFAKQCTPCMISIHYSLVISNDSKQAYI